MQNKYGVLSSSVDGQKLAATVEGIIAAVGGALVFAGVLDIGTETTLLSNVSLLFNDILVLTPLVISMGGICYTVFGLLRKAVAAISKKPQTVPSTPVTVVNP